MKFENIQDANRYFEGKLNDYCVNAQKRSAVERISLADALKKEVSAFEAYVTFDAKDGGLHLIAGEPSIGALRSSEHIILFAGDIRRLFLLAGWDGAAKDVFESEIQDQLRRRHGR